MTCACVYTCTRFSVCGIILVATSPHALTDASEREELWLLASNTHIRTFCCCIYACLQIAGKCTFGANSASCLIVHVQCIYTYMYRQCACMYMYVQVNSMCPFWACVLFALQHYLAVLHQTLGAHSLPPSHTLATCTCTCMPTHVYLHLLCSVQCYFKTLLKLFLSV